MTFILLFYQYMVIMFAIVFDIKHLNLSSTIMCTVALTQVISYSFEIRYISFILVVDESDPLPLVIGGAVGGVTAAGIIVALIVVFIFRRQKYGKKGYIHFFLNLKNILFKTKCCKMLPMFYTT